MSSSSYKLVSILGTNPISNKLKATVTNSTTINGVTTVFPTYTYTSQGFKTNKIPSITNDVITIESSKEITFSSYSNIVTSGRTGYLESTFIPGSSGLDELTETYFKCIYTLEPYNPSTGTTPILVSGKYIESLGNEVSLTQNKIFKSLTDSNKSTVYSFIDINNNFLGDVTFNPTNNSYTANSTISNKVNLENMSIIANAGFANIQFEQELVKPLLPKDYNEIMNSLYSLNAYPFNALIFNNP